MAFDFKAATPGAAPASALLFGADSQVAANPSVYTSTGSGNVVLATSPTLVTPTLGTPASGTLTNCTGLPVGGISATGTPSATTFLRGDGTWATPATGSGTVTSVAQTFTGGLISVAGSPVTTSGTLALTVAGTSGGIPYFSSASAWASSAALTANALVIGGGAGAAPATTTTGTGVLTALGNNVGSTGAFVTFDGALGTPSSGTLTSCTGLPISTGVSGLGTGVATFLATPSSANLAAAVTDETGTGPLVFANSPTFTDDITLGTQQTTQGAIILANTAAGAFATTIKSSNSASAAWTLTLPTTAGTNNYVLKTDGSGNTSWVAQSGGGGSPGGNSGQYQYNNAGSFGGIGLILFADTTFYVDPTGNNANDGSIGSPWATPQYAADVMGTIDANTYSVIIQINDGTYSAGAGVDVMAIMNRPKNCKFFGIYGNAVTPGNVVFDGVDYSSYCLSLGFRSDVFAIGSGVVVDEINGIRFKNATAGVYGSNSSSNVWLKDTEFENNIIDIWQAAYSGIYAENMKLIGNRSYICRATSYSNAYILNLNGDTGATFDTTAFDLIDTAIIILDTPDYTNITASGGATQWFVDAFSKLNTGGVAVPGAAGTTDVLGLVV